MLSARLLIAAWSSLSSVNTLLLCVLASQECEESPSDNHSDCNKNISDVDNM